MLKEIVEHIDGKLTYIDKAFGLAERISVNGDARPEAYLSRGEWVEISDFDKYNGVSYWRLNGEVSQDSERDNMVAGAKLLYSRSYPARFVVCVARKEITSEDTQYTADKLADKIISDMGNVSYSIKNSLNLRSCDLVIDSYTWDRDRIIPEEYTTPIKLNYEYFLLMFNCSINVVFTQSCLIDFCD